MEGFRKPLQPKAVGLEAFNSLRAEDEPWLHTCFVAPPEFERVIGHRSVIIFGGAGSGKTALYREAQACNWTEGGKPARLLVEWRPTPLPVDASPDLTWVNQQTKYVLDACANALAGYLAEYPESYNNADDWVGECAIWFIHSFLQGKPDLRLGSLTAKVSDGADLIRQILAAPVQEVLYEDAPLDMVVSEYVSLLQGLGLEGAWVLCDNLGEWADIDLERLTLSLSAFLSTLSLFECAGFAYKIWVPVSLESALSHAGGLTRRRVDGIHLTWTSEMLQEIVEKRLALALGRENFGLVDLCDTPGLLGWLEKVGGQSPRVWLDQIAPLVEHYTANHLSAPIDKASWNKLRERYPPRLSLDEARRRIMVGGHEIDLDDIPSKAYDMLCYLYKRGGKVITKAELYYRAYLGLESVPRAPGDESFENRKLYEGLIDTNLWRLRKAIEPDPSRPVLLETKRGHGIVLHVRW